MLGLIILSAGNSEMNDHDFNQIAAVVVVMFTAGCLLTAAPAIFRTMNRWWRKRGPRV